MNVNPFSYLIEKLKGKVDKSGDTMSGPLNIDEQNGSAGVEAFSTVALGNNKAYTQDKNSTGNIRLYSSTGKSCTLYPDAVTDNRAVWLPNASGTLALNIKEVGWHSGIYMDIGNGTYGIFCPYDVSVKGVPSVSVLDINIVGSYYQNITITLTRPNGILLKSDDLPNNASYVGRLCSAYFG